MVTMFTAFIFVTPYFILRSPDFLLHKPLQVFAEPACIVALVGAGLSFLLQSQIKTFWGTYRIYGFYAIETSLVSSAYYLFALRRAARKQTYAPAD